jgi:hypothetical protein
MIASNKLAAALALVLLAFVVLTPSPARAAQPSARTPTDAELETARSLYRDAVLLHRQEKLPEALARIAAAYRTVRTPIIALELGKIEAQLGRLADAFEALRGIEDLPMNPRETEKGRDARREAAALAASLRERLASIRVVVPNALADAEVRIDGERADSPEQPRVVDPGPHNVSFHAGGRACASSSITLQEGELRVIDLRDRLSACASGGSDASAASKESDRSTRPDEPSAASEANAQRSSGGSIALRDVAEIGLVSAGALATGIGAYVALRARADYAAVAPDCPRGLCSAEAYDVRQAARAHAIGATYAIAFGLASIASGVTLWLLDPARHPSQKACVGVAFAPSGVWMSVSIP